MTFRKMWDAAVAVFNGTLKIEGKSLLFPIVGMYNCRGNCVCFLTAIWCAKKQKFPHDGEIDMRVLADELGIAYNEAAEIVTGFDGYECRNPSHRGNLFWRLGKAARKKFWDSKVRQL